MKNLYWLFAAIFIATMLLYWSVFRFGLSTQMSDWGNFGSYFSGLIMPILTAINITVFVKMTKEISSLMKEEPTMPLKHKRK